MGCTGSTSASKPNDLPMAVGDPNAKLHKVVFFFGIPTAGKSWTNDFC